MATDPQQLPAVHEAWLPREHALHRPRHGGRQLTALICALVFFATPTLLWVFGVRPGEIENHRLSGFPSLAAGWGFFTGLPGWGTDQLAFRTGAIELADGISRGLFGESAPRDQGSGPAAGPLPGSPPPVGGTNQHPADAGSTDSEAGSRQVIEGNDGWLYFGADADLKCEPTRPLTETLNRMNTLRQAVEASGRKFVFVVAPDKSTMVPQHLPSSYPHKTCAQAASDPQWRQFASQGKALDMRPDLRAAEQRVGRPVYSPNDTHWSDEGAIEMTRAVAESLKPGVSAPWVATPTRQYTVGADLPPLLGRKDTKTNTEYALSPDGSIDRVGDPIKDFNVPTYRQGPALPQTINQRTLFFGDSFTYNSAHYLCAGFSDLRLLTSYTRPGDIDVALNEMVKSEVIVVEAVERTVSGGSLPFLEDSYLNAVKTALAQHPLR
ncbi:alginate O-acetyltransferase AlgX-related protein [Amycolatopsis sp. CA-230715]|uniref:alginate O-acetyltransferase AlgX-related protein n=1 Tax=Amycolatopsis sp. CA-230715 TaxID=2745196 RepID=UPI001C014F9F|nr:hypothetical protein [Amycolatopsis sp. CA-230715]QWF81476.1 hypothetical protein HUW46_04908 [Amycolatopsis sp. CA-230715]